MYNKSSRNGVACRHSKHEKNGKSLVAVVKRAHEKVLNFSLDEIVNHPSRASIGPGSEIEIKLALRQKINPFKALPTQHHNNDSSLDSLTLEVRECSTTKAFLPLVGCHHLGVGLDSLR